MTVNLTRIYTKLGDGGETHLGDMSRVSKLHPRVEAYGTVDETNATLGLARSTGLAASVDAVLARVQEDLFTLGAELACVPGREAKLNMPLLANADIERLERAIDDADAASPPLKTFVLPGGSPQAATLHLARTVCRRAERAVLAIDDAPPRREPLVYLNRLSDLVWAMARWAEGPTHRTAREHKT